MQLFKLKTCVHEFGDFASFAREFGLGSRDLVITNQFLYEPFMAALNLPCTFIMQEQYGQGEPSDEMMDTMLRDLQGREYDRVIAVGGGTVIDISKLFVLRGLSCALEAFDRSIPLVKDKHLVIIPTTAGTGSEVTNISIAEIKSRHTKMGLADDAIVADDAVIIPELLHGLPFRFWAASSIDALIHAVEAYVSPRANSYSRIFSLSAIESILRVFGEVAVSPEARHKHAAEMLRAANMAGIAFGNVGVGAVHALSYPLGGNYHVPHGEANYQLFTEVFKVYHNRRAEGAILELEAYMATQLQCPQDEVYEALDALLSRLIEHKPLRNYGMTEEECQSFATTVLQQQQRLLANNWVELSAEEIETIYRRLY